MASVFLSHTSADKPFVRKLATDLVLHGIRVWLDEAELLVGDSLLDRISTAITEMDYLAVVLTRKSVASNWVRRELEIAMSGYLESNQVKVLPIRADDCTVPAFLSGIFYIEMATAAQYLPGLRQLIRRLLPDTDFSPLERISTPQDERFAWVRNDDRRAALQSNKAPVRIAAIRNLPVTSSLGIPIALELLADRSNRVVEAAFAKLEEFRDQCESDYFENDQRLFGKNAFELQGKTLVYVGHYNLLQFLDMYFQENTLPRQTLQALVMCTNAINRMIRATALFCLGRTHASLAISQVVSCAMQDEDDLVREIAVWGVAEFSKIMPNQPRLQSALLISATDPVGDIRRQAIEGLRFHSGQSVIKCLAHLSHETTHDVRKRAMEILVEREEEDAYVALCDFFLGDAMVPVSESEELIRVFTLDDISHHSGKRNYEPMLIELLGQNRYAKAFERPNYPAKQVAASAISVLKTHGTHRCVPTIRQFENVKDVIKTHTDFASGAFWTFNIAEDVKEILTRLKGGLGGEHSDDEMMPNKAIDGDEE